MSHLLPRWIGRPSLRAAMITLLLVVLLPTLGVVAMALMNAGKSFRVLSEQRLQETAHILAQSSTSELDGTTRLLHALSIGTQPGTTGDAATGLTYGLWSVTGETITGGGASPPPGLRDLILDAARSGVAQASNILPATDPDAPPQIAFALPETGVDGRIPVATVTGHPSDLIRALDRQSDGDAAVILAITDGTGRILARSVDGDRLIGRPVPDWDRLVAMGTDSGSFRAVTLEGREIVFAFQKIAGTPGWAAVVGEPVATFDRRWLRPILVMIAASALTIILGVALALAILRRIQAPIRALASRAKAISTSSAETEDAAHTPIPPAYIREFETLRLSLDGAEQVLRGRLQDSRRAEAAARESLAALEQAEKLAKIGSWTLDLATGRFASSRMMRELNGQGPTGELAVEDLRRLMRPEEFDRVSEGLSRCIATGEPYALEIEHGRPDGTSFIAWVQGHAVRGPDGTITGVAGSVQDVTERREQTERLAALADNLPSGMIIRLERNADGQLRVDYVSGGVEDLTGHSPAEIMSNPGTLGAALHPDDLPAILEDLGQPASGTTVFDRQFRLIRPDGAQTWVRGRAALRHLPGGQSIWDGVILDITAERAAMEAMREARRSAETAERAKSDFLATMSHEIRTPMNSVIGMSRLALQTQLDPKQRNYLEKINESANVLLGLINDILDFSKIEAGGLMLEGTRFRLDSVLETVSALTALRAEEKGLELTLAVSPGLPAEFVGDPLRLGQVLTNLVGNAIKFTDHGDVVVSVTALGPAGDSGCKVQFSVRDTGIGLSPDQIRTLFQPFVQGDSDTARKYGGTGLGLAICRSLVELMGGRIWVDSDPGGGSTFHFTADLGLPQDDARAPTRALLAPDLKGRHALIVDDSDSARTALSDMVAGFGMETVTAPDGATALDLLRQRQKARQPFDIVLVDWRMPGMDGLELARHIRDDAGLVHLPAVLMVTAHGHQLVLSEADRLGLQGVLLKPVTQSVIFNTINDIFGHAPPDHSRSSRTAMEPDAEIAALTQRLSGRRVLVVDDNALNREVASDFLQIIGIQTETANDGAAALEAMAAASFDAVLMDVHMPVMNGLEAIARIRQRPDWAALPVIALTAQARVEDQEVSLKAGMSAHLSKPIDEMALYRLLDRLIPPAPAPEPEVTLPRMLQRFGNNQDRFLRFLGGFQRDFGDMVQVFDGLRDQGDLTGLADFAHRVKGVVGYLDANTLFTLSDQMEIAARAGDEPAVRALTPPFRAAMVECSAAVQQALRDLG